MDKNLSKLAASFPAFRFIGSPFVVDVQEVELKNDATNQLLDVIYAPDPFTGLPQSDIAVYLSDKVDPAIREFVASQLMTPNPNPQGVDDANSDILFDLVRQDSETVFDYAVRVRELVASDNETRIKESQTKESQSKNNE